LGRNGEGKAKEDEGGNGDGANGRKRSDWHGNPHKMVILTWAERGFNVVGLIWVVAAD
jgi:hypothetical protein